jgi:hypothetical protein
MEPRFPHPTELRYLVTLVETFQFSGEKVLELPEKKVKPCQFQSDHDWLDHDPVPAAGPRRIENSGIIGHPVYKKDIDPDKYRDQVRAGEITEEPFNPADRVSDVHGQGISSRMNLIKEIISMTLIKFPVYVDMVPGSWEDFVLSAPLSSDHLIIPPCKKNGQISPRNGHPLDQGI